MLNKNMYLKEPYTKDNYTIYEARFLNMYALYTYLKSNPKINRRVFGQRASLNDEYDFYGEDLDTAIEYLVSGYNRDYDQFLKLSRKLDSTIIRKEPTLAFERAPVGNRIHVPSVVAGSPKFMIRPTYEEEHEFVDIYFNLCYPAFTKKEAIRNRGIIALYIMRLLIKNDYGVNLKAFELSTSGREAVYINVGLKRGGDTLDLAACYYALVAREFSRRLCFYCKETMNMENLDWGCGYGSPGTERVIRQFFKLPDKTIVFDNPDEMGITDDLDESIDNVLKKIKLDRFIELRR